MKKLAIASAIIALSSSAIAADNSLYLQGGGAASWGSVLDSSKKAELGISSTDMGSLSLNPRGSFGYQFMDNVRTEIALSYFNACKYEDLKSTSSSGGTPILNRLGTKDTDPKAGPNVALDPTTGKVSIENSAWVSHANIFVDVVDMGAAKVYFGGGIGASYIESNLPVKFEGGSNGADTKLKFEKKVSFSWNAGAGISVEAATGMLFDFGYRYMDLGKPGKTTVAGVEIEWPLSSVALHNLTVGLRFHM